MAELNDFYKKGDTLLADVTIPAGKVRAGERITVPLSNPAEYIDARVTYKEGIEGGERDSFTTKRVVFDPTTMPDMNLPLVFSQAGTDLQTRIVREVVDTDLARVRTNWTAECRPANGVWGFTSTEVNPVLGTSDGKQGFVISNNPITTGDTDWKASDAGNVDSTFKLFQEGKAAAYVLKACPGYNQSSKFQDRWVGYHGTPAWIGTISPNDVIFHIYEDGVLSGQCVGLTDAPNYRIKGLGVTSDIPTNNWQLPAEIYEQFSNHRFLTKGFKMTQVEQGTTIDVTTDVVTWTGGFGATTYPTGNAGNFNHFVSGVIKLWDGADSTKFRIGTLSQATGTTSCTISYVTDINGYAHADGLQSNYEIWLWYDFVGGDDGYTPIMLESIPADTWGQVYMSMVTARDFGKDTGFRAPFYQYRPDDWYFNNAGIEYCRIDTISGFFDDSQTNTESSWVEPDHSKLTLRQGGAYSTGITLNPGEFMNCDFMEVYFSLDGGLSFYVALKDPRETGVGFMHAIASTSGNTMFVKRKVAKFEGGTWQLNRGGFDTAIVDNGVRFTDPDTYFVDYVKEDWVVQGDLTNLSDAAKACGRYNFEGIGGTWPLLNSILKAIDSVWLFNDTAATVNVNLITDTNRWDDRVEEIGHHGMRIHDTGSQGNIRDGQARYILSADGTSVDVVIAKADDGLSDGTALTNPMRQIEEAVFGEINIKITGKIL